MTICLLGKRGRLLNAGGGICTVLLVVTGAIIWWPGIDTWRRSLSFRWKASPSGYSWTLHSGLGFWTVAFFFMWAAHGNLSFDSGEVQRRGRFPGAGESWEQKSSVWRQAAVLDGAGALRAVCGHRSEDRLDGRGTCAGSLICYRADHVVERVVKPWRRRVGMDSTRVRQVQAARSEDSVQACA